jgi:hypothetical protein
MVPRVTVPSPVDRTRLLLVAPVSVNTASACSRRPPSNLLDLVEHAVLHQSGQLVLRGTQGGAPAVQLRQREEELEQLLPLLPRGTRLTDRRARELRGLALLLGGVGSLAAGVLLGLLPSLFGCLLFLGLLEHRRAILRLRSARNNARSSIQSNGWKLAWASVQE